MTTRAPRGVNDSRSGGAEQRREDLVALERTADLRPPLCEAATGTMVLPPHERSSGDVAVERGWLGRDLRVPEPLRREGEYSWDADAPRVAGHSPYLADVCGDGRHLFDVIESTIHREVETEESDGSWSYREEVDFRARLTCVRCGTILRWEGTRTEERPRRIDPVPLRAGGLVAQQVNVHDGFGGRDMSQWTIYRDGAAVGHIDWGSGPRGRAFHRARLEEWPEGQTVQGADPAAVLRRAVKRDRELAATPAEGRRP